MDLAVGGDGGGGGGIGNKLFWAYLIYIFVVVVVETTTVDDDDDRQVGAERQLLRSLLSMRFTALLRATFTCVARVCVSVSLCVCVTESVIAMHWNWRTGDPHFGFQARRKEAALSANVLHCRRRETQREFVQIRPQELQLFKFVWPTLCVVRVVFVVVVVVGPASQLNERTN